MDYFDRNEILQSEKFKAQCRIALCDWVQYCVTTGTSIIEDQELKSLTETFLRVFLGNISETFVDKIAHLAISEPSVLNSTNVTDLEVKTAVDHLMATSLQYLL